MIVARHRPQTQYTVSEIRRRILNTAC